MLSGLMSQDERRRTLRMWKMRGVEDVARWKALLFVQSVRACGSTSVHAILKLN